MSGPQELIITAAFGQTADLALLLAEAPDDDEDDEEISAGSLTYVLELKQGKTKIINQLSTHIYSCWRSQSGAAYCSAEDGLVYVYYQGKWVQEKVSDHPVSFRFMWGFSGKSDAEDLVFLCSHTTLFIRDHRVWRAYPLPETIESTSGIHGLSPDDLYISSKEGLVHWDGTQFEELELPDPYDVFWGLRVLSKDSLLLVGEKHVYQWRDQKGWDKSAIPSGEGTVAIMEQGGKVFIGTDECLDESSPSIAD